MKHIQSFVVSRFTNPFGDVVFRVSGWLDGIRVRRNFPTRAEAQAERQSLGIQQAQAGALRMTATRLTDDQIQEAEMIFRRLTGRDRSLSFYMEFALANYREPARQKPLPEAIAEYVAAKRREHEQGQLSVSQFTRIERDLKRFERHFPAVTIAEVTAKRLAEFFNLGNPSFKTHNNRRGIVSTFLNFGFRNEWITENPILKVHHHRIRRRRCAAATLSAAQAQELMAHVEEFQGGRLVPFFALCLFAGIRPCLKGGEVFRLKPEQVRLDDGVIAIDERVSKVGEKRTVTIQPNLGAWLRAYPLERFPIVVPNLQRHRARIATKFGLSHDIMRHSFISFFVARFRSVGEAALQAGNSESVIRKHYLDLKTAAEAAEFFNILPKRTDTSATTVTAAAARHNLALTVVARQRQPRAA